jgi:hypothetical protein
LFNHINYSEACSGGDDTMNAKALGEKAFIVLKKLKGNAQG